MKVENFVKQVEEIKVKNELDLSLGEDLSIALMNLISLEEHFEFSFMKTSEARYLEMLEQVRELRKRMLKKIVKENEGEDWCASKHLLAASMRLTEVGTKYLHVGRKEEAEECFVEAFNLYSLFWRINGVGTHEENAVENKKIETSPGKLSKLSALVKKMVDCCKE